MQNQDTATAPQITTQAPPDDFIWTSARPFPINRRRDRRTPAVPQVIAIEPVTDALRAATPHLPVNARYVAAIRADGVLVDVLAIPAFDLQALPELREYAKRAAAARGAGYYETGVDCGYCGRLCPPDVAFDHARWLCGNEARWSA